MHIISPAIASDTIVMVHLQVHKMQPSYLGKLEKGRPKVFVSVRVVRKWSFKENFGQGPPLYIGLVLVDTKVKLIYSSRLFTKFIKT